MPTNIQGVSKHPQTLHPILHLGFRIFFAGAAVFAIVSMSLWLAILQGFAPFNNTAVHIFYWHAHEMVFGYALAVIAGFLLTAVKTWTNQPMPYGWHLGGIFLAWALARLLWLGLHASSSIGMLISALVCDFIFWALLCLAVIKAVYRARQKRQIGITAKLILLAVTHLAFYAGVFLAHTQTQRISVYLALYLVIGVVFTIIRRVLPFFISKGVNVDDQGKPTGAEIAQKNSTSLDRASLFGFFGFALFDLCALHEFAAVFALICLVANVIRLANWYHHGIWHKPLLWSLVIAFLGMTISLILLIISAFFDTALNLHSLGLHGLALFGIGLMTVAMMARVSLGHTGRNIHQPPRSVGLIFWLMILAALTRVVMPLFGNGLAVSYMQWILISQVLWIASFALFFVSYIGMLAKARVDGLFG